MKVIRRLAAAAIQARATLAAHDAAGTVDL
jgi:hypothetical protein